MSHWQVFWVAARAEAIMIRTILPNTVCYSIVLKITSYYAVKYSSYSLMYVLYVFSLNHILLQLGLRLLC